MGLLRQGAGRTDGEVVRAILAGDAEQFGVLVERYREEFAHYAAGLCGDGDIAQDAMQEAFIRAFRSLASCRDPDRFKAWFFRILTNQCHNARDRRRQHASIDDVAIPAGDDAEAGAMEEEVRGQIEAALDELTPGQREAFVLKHIEGYSYGEIAEMLDEGVDALKMRVHRARDVIRKRLEHLR